MLARLRIVRIPKSSRPKHRASLHDHAIPNLHAAQNHGPGGDLYIVAQGHIRFHYGARTNLDALAGMTTLQSLILPPNAGPIQFLRGLTNLTRLSFRYDPATKRAAQSTAAFWAEYDQTHP